MCTELAASCHKRQIFSVFRAIQSHSDVRMGVKILRNLANFCENGSQRLLHCESSCAFRGWWVMKKTAAVTISEDAAAIGPGRAGVGCFPGLGCGGVVSEKKGK